MHIYHIADIHIRERRFVNLRHAFSELFAAIRRDPQPKVLVIAGDVFDAKYSTTLVDFNFFNEVMEWDACPIMIIPGNHDMNINNLDSINCVGFACNSRCVVANVPTIKTYENVDFYLHPFGAPPMESDKNSAKVSIAVVHATITGCVSSGGMQLTGSAAADYMHFDAVLLGDIHKRQEVAPRMWYPGSFTQVAIDEGIDHGYLIWDTNNLERPHYVSIRQPIVDVKLRFRNDVQLDEIKIEGDQTVRRMALKFYSCTNAYYESVAAKYSAMYPGVIEITDETRVRDMIMDVRDMPNLTKINVLEILLRNCDTNKQSAIHDLYNRYLQNFDDRGHRRFKLMYMEWGNLFCYSARNYINFEDLGMVTSIVGVNGSGKTSIFKILNFALYRTVLGEKERYSTIVRSGATNGFVDICAMSGNESVVLRLTATKISNGTKNRYDSKIYIRGDDSTGDTAAATEEIKRSIYGAASIFRMINIIDGSNSFTESAAKKYKESLISLFGFGYIEDVIKEIKRDRDSNKKLSAELSGKLIHCEKIINSTAKHDMAELTAAASDINLNIKVIQRQIAAIPYYDDRLLEIQIPQITQPDILHTVNGDFNILRKYKFPKDERWQQQKYYPEHGFALPESDYEYIDGTLTHHRELRDVDDFVPIDGHELMTVELTDELFLLRSLNLDVPMPVQPRQPTDKFLNLTEPNFTPPRSQPTPKPYAPQIEKPYFDMVEPQPIEIQFPLQPQTPDYDEFIFPDFVPEKYVSSLAPVSRPQQPEYFEFSFPKFVAEKYISSLAPVSRPDYDEFAVAAFSFPEFVPQQYVSFESMKPPQQPEYFEFSFPDFVPEKYVSSLAPISRPQQPEYFEFSFPDFVPEKYVSSLAPVSQPLHVPFPESVPQPSYKFLTDDEVKITREHVFVILYGSTKPSSAVIDFISQQELNTDCISCLRLKSWCSAAEYKKYHDHISIKVSPEDIQRYKYILNRIHEAELCAEQTKLYNKYLEDKEKYDAFEEQQKKYAEFNHHEEQEAARFFREQKEKYDESHVAALAEYRDHSAERSRIYEEQQKKYDEYIRQEEHNVTYFYEKQKKEYDMSREAALVEYRNRSVESRRMFEEQQKKYNEYVQQEDECRQLFLTEQKKEYDLLYAAARTDYCVRSNERRRMFEEQQKKYNEYVQREEYETARFYEEQKEEYDMLHEAAYVKYQHQMNTISSIFEDQQKKYDEYIQHEEQEAARFFKEQKNKYDESYAAARGEYQNRIDKQRMMFDEQQKKYNDEIEYLERQQQEYTEAVINYRGQKKVFEERTAAYIAYIEYDIYVTARCEYDAYMLYLEQKKKYDEDQTIRIDWMKYEEQIRVFDAEYQIATAARDKKLRRGELENINSYTENFYKYQHNQAVLLNRRIIQNRLHGNLYHLTSALYYMQIAIRQNKQLIESLRYQLSNMSTKQLDVERRLAIAARDCEMIDSMNSDLIKYSEEKANYDTKIQEMDYFIKLLIPNSSAMNCLQNCFMQDIINRMNILFDKYEINMKVEQDEEARFVLHHHRRTTPIAAASKGQTFIVDLIFRVSVIQSHVSPCMKFIILDENLECLDVDNRPKIWKLIQEVGIPFIIVSHSENIQTKIDTRLNIVQSAESATSQITHGRSVAVNIRNHVPMADTNEQKALDEQPAASEINIPQEAKNVMDFYTLIDGEYVCNICKQKYKKRSAYMDKHIAVKHNNMQR